MKKGKYTVCRVADDTVRTYVTVSGAFDNSRAAEKYIKENGEDGLEYAIIKIGKTLKVETVSRRALSEV